MTKKQKNTPIETDIVLIGAGIMSATLGVLLKQLMPDARIKILERLDEVAAESSDAWNNAGTGHSALCELNYTPKSPMDPLLSIKPFKLPNPSKFPSNFGHLWLKKT